MSDDQNDESPSPDTDTADSVGSVDTDQWEQIYQTHYDREAGDELATVIIFAIADAKGVDPLDRVEMPPLYESIDANALEETFFGPSGARSQRTSEGAITFGYNGYKIGLRSDGWIFVYEPR